MEAALLTTSFIKQFIAIVIVIGANIGYNVLLHYVFTNTLYITLLSYIGIFISIMIIYFLIFDFTITALFSFIIALIVSIVISIFLMIFMSPSYCSADGNNGGNLGVYFETFLYGLLVYMMYVYLTTYVMPFYNNPALPNQIRYDLMFGGMITVLGIIILILNSYVRSEVFKNINFYTVFVYVFILSMKIYVIGLQSFNKIATPPMSGGYERMIREPDYMIKKPVRKRMSAFYNLH